MQLEGLPSPLGFPPPEAANSAGELFFQGLVSDRQRIGPGSKMDLMLRHGTHERDVSSATCSKVKPCVVESYWLELVEPFPRFRDTVEAVMVCDPLYRHSYANEFGLNDFLDHFSCKCEWIAVFGVLPYYRAFGNIPRHIIRDSQGLRLAQQSLESFSEFCSKLDIIRKHDDRVVTPRFLGCHTAWE